LNNEYVNASSNKCLPCPLYSSSHAGSTVIDDCICDTAIYSGLEFIPRTSITCQTREGYNGVVHPDVGCPLCQLGSTTVADSGEIETGPTKWNQFQFACIWIILSNVNISFQLQSFDMEIGWNNFAVIEGCNSNSSCARLAKYTGRLGKGPVIKIESNSMERNNEMRLK